MRNAPIVSIGLGVYKGKNYITQALDSLMHQSFSDFELIIGDNGSTDGSREICLGFASSDKRIKYFRHEVNIGTQRNFNFLISKASGKYFMLAADDDLWHPDYIKVLVEVLEKNPASFSAMTTTRFIDEEGDPIMSLKDKAVDYSGDEAYQRLSKLVNIFDDCMTYGLFRNDLGKLYFPVWKGINKKDPLNCAYPVLCYILTKGDFALVKSDAVWYNRIKLEVNYTHKRPFTDSFVVYNYAFVLRKLNLLYESIKLIRLAGGNWNLVLKLLPSLTRRWFFTPCLLEVKRTVNLLRAKKIKIV